MRSVPVDPQLHRRPEPWKTGHELSDRAAVLAEASADHAWAASVLAAMARFMPLARTVESAIFRTAMTATVM